MENDDNELKEDEQPEQNETPQLSRRVEDRVKALEGEVIYLKAEVARLAKNDRNTAEWVKERLIPFITETENNFKLACEDIEELGRVAGLDSAYEEVKNLKKHELN